MHLSGLQPLEDTVVTVSASPPIRSETAGVLADAEDNLGDTAGTLGETGPLGDTTRTLDTPADTTETLENTAAVTDVTSGTTEVQQGQWIPEPASPEWDPSGEPHRHPQCAPLLAVSPRSHSVV